MILENYYNQKSEYLSRLTGDPALARLNDDFTIERLSVPVNGQICIRSIIIIIFVGAPLFSLSLIRHFHFRCTP